MWAGIWDKWRFLKVRSFVMAYYDSEINVVNEEQEEVWIDNYGNGCRRR